MGIAETKIYPINTGWLEADLGTYTFWKGPAGKKIWNPCYCYYVDTGEYKYDLIEGPASSNTIHNSKSFSPSVQGLATVDFLGTSRKKWLT